MRRSTSRSAGAASVYPGQTSVRAVVHWDRGVAWCSYTRAPLLAPTHAALRTALGDLGLTFCGQPDALPRPRLPVLA